MSELWPNRIASPVSPFRRRCSTHTHTNRHSHRHGAPIETDSIVAACNRRDNRRENCDGVAREILWATASVSCTLEDSIAGPFYHRCRWMNDEEKRASRDSYSCSRKESQKQHFVFHFVFRSLSDRAQPHTMTFIRMETTITRLNWRTREFEWKSSARFGEDKYGKISLWSKWSRQATRLAQRSDGLKWWNDEMETTLIIAVWQIVSCADFRWWNRSSLEAQIK